MKSLLAKELAERRESDENDDEEGKWRGRSWKSL
jgi:hypothetical protein